MNARTTLIRHWRAILDCLLIVLIILVAGAAHLPVQAGPAMQGQTLQIQAGDALAATGLSLENTQAPAAPQLDNNTLAGIIAAENAALTEAIFFNDLPFVVR
jgi:ABC-type enterobactin transport system permease subunit